MEPRARATLGAFIGDYIASRKDAAPNTQRNWKNSRAKLVGFLGEDRDLRSIGLGDADDWRQAMVNAGSSEATISKATKHAKQFLAAAVRKRLAEANPFRELKAGGERNDERKVFVPREAIAKAIEAAPDAEWRAIIALARYAGLRTPSETLALEWDHVDWGGGKLTVPSPKTKRHGKGWRTIPLFGELRAILADAYDVAPPGARYVVRRYRGSNANLRAQFLRILRRAGVAPWERLFHNLRGSLQTELANQFPAHVVCEWLGNSETVATNHYLQVTEDHYQQAIGGPTGGPGGGPLMAKVGPQVATHPTETSGKYRQETQAASGVMTFPPVFPEADAMLFIPPGGVQQATSMSAAEPKTPTGGCRVKLV